MCGTAPSADGWRLRSVEPSIRIELASRDEPGALPAPLGISPTGEPRPDERHWGMSPEAPVYSPHRSESGRATYAIGAFLAAGNAPYGSLCSFFREYVAVPVTRDEDRLFGTERR
jgi:hypothetical protein